MKTSKVYGPQVYFNVIDNSYSYLGEYGNLYSYSSQMSINHPIYNKASQPKSKSTIIVTIIKCFFYQLNLGI